MKIALIDNGSRSVERLASILRDEVELEIIAAEKLSEFNDSEYSGIVLSGGNKWSILYKPERFEAELNLIKSTKKPVLGICLGAELLAFAFGGVIQELPEKVRQEISSQIVNEDPIIPSTEELNLIELHRFSITELPPDFKEIAVSTTGIELFRQNDTFNYGMQFHPELSESGVAMLQNWLELVATQA